MSGKRKKPAIPKVFKPRAELVEETQGWVKKRAITVDIPQAIQEETKEETKTVRPDVRAYYPFTMTNQVGGKLTLCSSLIPT